MSGSPAQSPSKAQSPVPLENLSRAMLSGSRQEERTIPAMISTRADQVVAVAKQLQGSLNLFVKDPRFQTIFVSSAGCAVTFATIGGGAGLVGGSATGLAVGVVPAIFTFGLSIPVGGVVGGIVGTGAGTVIGGGTGLIGGGVAAGVVYAYRVQIKNGAVYVTATVKDLQQKTKVKALKAKSEVYVAIRDCARIVNCKTKKMFADSKVLVADRKFQVTMASGAGSAAVCGAVGGGLGVTTGAMLGGAIGIIPAVFTLGLSIPLGAAIGGSTGLCVGTAGGGSAGFVSGSAVGYGAYSKRKEIGDAKNKAKAKAGKLIEYVAGKDGGNIVQRTLRGCTGGA